MADIDLNCDLGEGCGHDAELMPLITSANIACGAHAGDPMTMAEAAELAKARGVTIGAHPGYFDREHFGRRELLLPFEHILNQCAYQVGALTAVAGLIRYPVKYIKPHGGLYNRACGDNIPATAMLTLAYNLSMPLLALPESNLERLCENAAVPFFREGFADRRYRPDGSLVPRAEPDAFIHDPDEAVTQAEWLIENRGVRSLCVHGDNPDSVRFVVRLREALLARGHRIVPFA